MAIVIGIIVIVIVYNMFSNSNSKTYSNTYNPTEKPPKYQAPQKPIIPQKKLFKSKNQLPENLEITEEFQQAFDLMEQTNKCAYITGKAGTGKSTLLTYFKKKTKKNIVILAPTGIAAINVEGATIHSFFRFAPQLIKRNDISKDYNRSELFNKIETIIIDEISMVRADLLDAINYSLQINRGNDKPFGGVQIIFFGDLYQLPPVVVGKDLLDYFEENFGGYYFFNAKVFDNVSFDYIELQKIFRQKDENFKNILNNIRENKITNNDLSILNERFDSNHSYNVNDISLTLSTTNKIADDINRERMYNLPTQEYYYDASITGKFEISSFPTESRLILKKGAQVMMLKNDSEKRWVNGSLGKIKKLSDFEIEVEINETTYTIERATWESIEYQYNKEEKKIEAIVTGSFTQYALKPAWAITIHKSQGQTFDSVIINLGTGAFAHGQTYVALSRCKSLEGITLKTKVRSQDIILDPKVAKFIREKTTLNF